MPRKVDWASEAAKALWADCMDRNTIKHGLMEVSSRVKWDAILPKWAALIRKALKAGDPARKEKKQKKGDVRQMTFWNGLET